MNGEGGRAQHHYKKNPVFRKTEINFGTDFYYYNNKEISSPTSFQSDHTYLEEISTACRGAYSQICLGKGTNQLVN